MWDNEVSTASRAARAAGRILERMFGNAGRIMKKGDIDLVTDADLESEKAILDIIRGKFPDDGIHSEEAGRVNPGSERTWLVDPLDGTTNFAHGFPFFAVSIALQVKDEIVLGAVYNPFLNRKPIRVSKTHLLSDALLATGFPYDVHDRPHEIMNIFAKMVAKARGVRRPGSAAIDLCYVAAGRFDGFWETGLKPWDTAAATVILKEAGGALSTFDGAAYAPCLDSVVASNGLLHDPLLAVFRE
jgi:myo-inositol-1(or 4)-monophosphatase